jgi:predicted RNase H-like HicB family nuclease
VTFGETFDDAMQMAQDAITGCVAVMEQEGIDIVDDSMVYIESSIRIPSLLGRMSAASHLAYV